MSKITLIWVGRGKPGFKQFRTFAETKEFSNKLPVGTDDLWKVEKESDLMEIHQPVLVHIFNHLHTEKDFAITRFKDQKEAARRTFAALSGQLENPPPPPIHRNRNMSENNTAASTLTPEQVEALKTELQQLDKAIADAKEKFTNFTTEKKARQKAIRVELKAAGKAPRAPREPGAVSEVGKTVLEMLATENGASKSEIEAALPGSKPAYISALIGRVLPERGYKIEGRTVEGTKGKRYFLIGRPRGAEPVAQ